MLTSFSDLRRKSIVEREKFVYNTFGCGFVLRHTKNKGFYYA